MATVNLPGESRAPQIQAACIAFFVLSPLFVALRVWSRVKTRSWSGLSWDDWAVFVSWLFAAISSVLLMVACVYGLGQHAADLSEPNKLMALEVTFIADVFYKLTINLTKASILLLYLRSFVTKWFRVSSYTLLGVVLAFMVATSVSSIVQCSPVPRAWDSTIPGTCINPNAYWYANSGFAILTDVLILALPFQPIHASQLPGAQKVALMIVFALGMFTTIASVLRMQTFSLSGDSDLTYDIDSSIWAVLEANLAIICACLPVYRYPLAYIFPAQFSRSWSTKPADSAVGGSPASRSESSLPSNWRTYPNGKNRAGLPSSKISAWAVDEEKGLGDLPLPPSINPDAPRRWSLMSRGNRGSRGSVMREAYVWLSTVV